MDRLDKVVPISMSASSNSSLLNELCNVYGPAGKGNDKSPVENTSIPALFMCTAADPRGTALSEPKAVADAYLQAKQSVVRITAGPLAGTGFFVKSNGEILTDRHVVDQAGNNAITVTTDDGKTHVATVVSEDKAHDMALLKISSNSYRALPIADSNYSPKLSEEVLAVGHPSDWTKTYLSTGAYLVTEPVINTATKELGEDPNKQFIVTLMHTEPGSSGSPMLDKSGKVIGMVDLDGVMQDGKTNTTIGTTTADINKFLGTPEVKNYHDPVSVPSYLGLANIATMFSHTKFGASANAGIFSAISAAGAGIGLYKDINAATSEWHASTTKQKIMLGAHIGEDAVWLGGSLIAMWPQTRPISAFVGFLGSVARDF